MMDLSGLKSAYDHNPLGFLLLEALMEDGQAEDMVVRYANPAAAALMGRALEPLSGLRVSRLAPACSGEWLQPFQKAAFQNKQQSFYSCGAGGRQMMVDCFPYAPGLCGCMIQDMGGEFGSLSDGPELARELRGISETEASLSQLMRRYAIPFSELYFLRSKEDFVYLSDPETYKLLYISASNVEELLPGCADYLNKKCYEALQNRSAPCPFCTNSLLRFDQYYTWQHHNEVTGKDYLLRDKLTYWEGRVARMEVVMDITDAERKGQLLAESMASRSLFMSCSAALNGGGPLGEAVRKVLADICAFYQADSGMVLLFEQPHICVSWSRSGQYRVEQETEYPSAAAVEEWGRLLRDKNLVMVPDVEQTGAAPGLKAGWRSQGVRSIALTPMLEEGRLRGYLQLHNISENLVQIAELDTIVSTLAGAVKNRALQVENQRLQYRDPLTGCLNFGGFKRWSARLLRQNPRRGYAVWYCDIKRFKYINDVFGYEAGDRLLRRWTQVIEEGLQEGELFGRVSGDNMALLTNAQNARALEARFWTMVEAVREFLNRPNRSFEVEISAGIYLLGPRETAGLNLNQMLDWANVAQKSVKQLSGSHVAFFTEDLWQRQLRELEISQHMRDALSGGEFSVWFQPQYDYSSGKLIGAEALVRWEHPTLGRLMPGEFIPILERDGQITALDQYVWEEACRYMRSWLDAGDRLLPVSLSVNVSRKDICSTDLCAAMSRLVERYGLPPAMLRLEITESAYMEEPEQLIEVTDRLRALGFTVEMDDFGSGYSSLNTLKDVPVDILKLDMCFLSGTDNTVRGGNILSSVVRMAHWLELPVIAEGVETQEQADYLKSLGCTLMQGYYFAKPMPAKEFERLLGAGRVEDIQRKFTGVGLMNMAEFLDTNSKSSFLFNSCIGGAVLLEFDGTNTEALMLNDAFYDAVGIPRQRFERFRTDMLRVICPEDRRLVQDTLERAVRGGTASCEACMSREECGEERWIRIAYRHLSSSVTSHILFVMVEDVTGQHRTREQLDEVTQELRSYLDLMPGGVFRCTADQRQEFDYVSRGLLEMLGHTREQFQSRYHNCFPQMVYPGDRERVQREIAQHMREGETGFCEYRVVTADGGVKWVYDVWRLVADAKGNRWFYDIITDIDAQKNAEGDQLFQTCGKAMAELFDEVADVDYGRDAAVLLHSRSHGAQVGVKANGVADTMRRSVEKWGLGAGEREKFLRFIARDHVQQCYLDGRAASVQVRTQAEEWYTGLLLPLSPARGLYCSTCITAQKQSERLMVESARLEALQDLFANLPVGAGIFERKADGSRQLQFVSQTACRILHTTPQRLRTYFQETRWKDLLPELEDPRRRKLLLDSEKPSQRRLELCVEDEACVVDLVTKLVEKPDGTVVGYAAVLDAADQVEARHTRMWHQTLYRILAQLPKMLAFDYDPVRDRMTNCLSDAEHSAEPVVERYLEQLDQMPRLTPESVEIVRSVLREALERPISGTVDYRADYFGAGYRWSRAHYASLADENGRVYRVVGRVDDIEEEMLREQTLREMAQRDAMTGFLNHDASRRSIGPCLKAHGGGTLMIVDIDDFKKVNDVLGHLFGDTFLKLAADAIRELFRKEDILGRFGGDEFMILLPGVQGERLVRRRAQNVVQAIAQIEVPELGQIRCSIGVAIAKSGQTDPDELFRQADFALYQSKQAGKGHYTLFQGGGAVRRMPPAQPRRAEEGPADDIRPSVLAGDVFSILYHAEITRAGIQQALAHVGRWLDVSRMYIVENTPDGSYSVNTFEWCADGVSAQMDNLQHICLCPPGGNYYENFNKDDIFYCPDVSVLPAWQRELLAGQEVRAMLQWAFRDRGEIRGFVGFDECRQNRLWVRRQVDCLVRAAEVISVFLQRLRRAQGDTPEQ